MTFINPAFLFGLIAASLPILLHILNLRKLKTIEFSSLQFLKEMQKNKIRRLKLKQLLLLIIRTLLIISIVIAFARPTIDGSITGFESFAKSSSVILVDNSFSLDFSDENGNRFNQTKKIVNEIIENMNEGEEATIIEIANVNDFKVYEFTRNIDYLKDQISKLQISYQPADLNKGLQLSAKVLENANNITKNIFIVTDAQPNIFEQSETEKIETEHTNIYFISVGNLKSSNIKNLSLDSINILSRIFQINKSVELEGRIRNNANSDVEGTIMKLFFNDNNVAQRNFNIQSEQIKNISIGATAINSGVVNAYIELENDAFIEDNKKYFGFIIPDKPNIALFSNDNINTNFVHTAITATGRDGFAKINYFPSDQIASANLSQFDLILIANGNYSSSDYKLIKDYISNGGSALIFANDQTDKSVFANAMFELGFGNVYMKEYSKKQPAQFITTDKMHPLFEGVFKIDNDSRSVVESPKIFKAIPALDGQSLIDMGDGSFLAENVIGDGKVLYCAVVPTLEWSTFPVTGIFPTIMIRSVAYLGSHPELSYNFEMGKDATIQILKKYATSGNFRIVDPNGNEFLRQSVLLPSGAILDFNDMNLPGLYTIYNSNNVVVALMALNLQSSESDFTKFNKEQLLEKLMQQFAGEPKIELIENGEDVSERIERTRAGTELWRLFVLLALLLAISEMLVQRNSIKDESNK
jgi:hypothetical protein